VSASRRFAVDARNVRAEKTPGLPPKAIDRADRATVDADAYKVCMKARMFTIHRLLKGDIRVPYEMLKVETIYLQFRLLLEMLYLSAIATRRQKYRSAWPRSEREYQPSEIRKYLAGELDEHFPRPFEVDPSSGAVSSVVLVERPVTEEEVYAFFNRCHRLLHEPNPYKRDWRKREAECSALLREAGAFLIQLRDLLSNHLVITELDDGEKTGMICALGAEDEEVTVHLVVRGD
jgi:hypothetical protein